MTIQQQILELMRSVRDELGISFLFISHDLSVVEHISHRVGVMYLGNIVELGEKKQIFANPMHPYTRALLSAVPMPDPTVKMNRTILQGDLPSPSNPPKGCKFCTRCPECKQICREKAPVFREYEPGHSVACHLYPQE